MEVNSAEVTMEPKSVVEVGEAEAPALVRLMDALDDHDDVNEVHANFDIPGAACWREEPPSRVNGTRFRRHPGLGPESVRVIVVMGIDPGVASTGFGVVRVAGSRR